MYNKIDVAIIGPSGSGKTTLLRALAQYHGEYVDLADPTSVFFVRQSRRALMKGRLADATEEVSSVRFIVNQRCVQLYDTPGGSIFSPDGAFHATTQQVLEILRGCAVVILCFDPTSLEGVRALAVDISNLMYRIKKKWRTVVFCYNRADVILRSESAASQSPNLALGRQLSGDLELSQALTLMEQTAAGFLARMSERWHVLWISSYGFARSDGRPNFNSQLGTLRCGVSNTADGNTIVDYAELLRDWRPTNIETVIKLCL